MMFLGTFFEFPVQACRNVFQRDRRHFAPVTVPFWLSTWRAAACEESRDCFSAMRSTAQGGSAQLLRNARHAGEGAFFFAYRPLLIVVVFRGFFRRINLWRERTDYERLHRLIKRRTLWKRNFLAFIFFI